MLTNNYNMKINIDNSESKTNVFNKEKCFCFKEKDIIEIHVNTSNITNVIVALYSGIYDFSNIESYIFKYLITSDKEYYSNNLCKSISRLINKSFITIKRAIDSLRKKNLIYINEENKVCLSSTIKTSKDDLDKAKCLFITTAEPLLI